MTGQPNALFDLKREDGKFLPGEIHRDVNKIISTMTVRGLTAAAKKKENALKSDINRKRAVN